MFQAGRSSRAICSRVRRVQLGRAQPGVEPGRSPSATRSASMSAGGVRDGPGSCPSGTALHQAGRRSRGGLLLVRDVLQDQQRHDRDGLAEVEDPGCGVEDRGGIAGVGVHVGGGALAACWSAGRGRGPARSGRCPRTRSGTRARSPGPPRACSRRSAGRSRCPGTAGCPPRRPGTGPRGRRNARLARTPGQDAGDGRDDLLGCFPVGFVVVFTAEPVVIDPGRVRDAGIKGGQVRPDRILAVLEIGGSAFAAHWLCLSRRGARIVCVRGERGRRYPMHSAGCGGKLQSPA